MSPTGHWCYSMLPDLLGFEMVCLLGSLLYAKKITLCVPPLAYERFQVLVFLVFGNQRLLMFPY